MTTAIMATARSLWGSVGSAALSDERKKAQLDRDLGQWLQLPHGCVGPRAHHMLLSNLISQACPGQASTISCQNKNNLETLG